MLSTPSFISHLYWVPFSRGDSPGLFFPCTNSASGQLLPGGSTISMSGPATVGPRGKAEHEGDLLALKHMARKWHTPFYSTLSGVSQWLQAAGGLEMSSCPKSKGTSYHSAINHQKLFVIKCQLTMHLGVASFCRQQGIENSWFIKWFISQLLEHFTFPVLTLIFSYPFVWHLEVSSLR